MSNENSPPPTPSLSSTRRASFAPGQKISELFSRSPGGSGPTGTSAYPGPIAAAAANAQAHQRRRMSISTLGLSGSPTQTSPFGGLKGRQESTSSNGSGSPDMNESAIEDGDATSTPTTPFARRMSFGARAIGNVRGGAGNFNGEGFNWSDQLRSRAQRSTSITSPTAASAAAAQDHHRSAAMAAMEPPKQTPKVSKAPDHFQERILKGDFYMD